MTTLRPASPAESEAIAGLWPDLLPDVPRPLRRWEVVVTVPQEDGGVPLVPAALPGGVTGCWSALQATASARVDAACASEAVRLVETLVPDLARAAGARFEVRPA